MLLAQISIPLPPRLAAEFIGTWALVFVGAGAVVTDAVHGGALGHVGVSLAFGLVVMAVIYAVGEVSGAHINPAVTLAFWASGRLKGRYVLPYIAAQAAGTLVAGGVLLLLFGNVANLGATAPAGGAGQSFGLEVLITFLLMFVILGVSKGSRESGIMAGAAVGGTVALAALFAGPVSGASMNPARSLGPAVFGGGLEHLWIYWTAPFLGALLAVPLAALVYRWKARG